MPVFVLGCERSGSTWVANILGRWPGLRAAKAALLHPALAAQLG